MDKPDLNYAIGLEPRLAVEYFRSKGYEITFRWQDMEREAHAKAFTAAGVMRRDVLETIRAEVDKGIRDGIPMDQFVRSLAPRLQKMGFWGKQEITDPNTGEIRTINVTPWRLRNLYRVNMQVALSRGRWQNLKDNARFEPFWILKSLMDGRERLSHGLLNNTVLAHDDPAWEKIFPPIDWGCRCWVNSATQRDLDRLGLKVRSGKGLEKVAGKDWNFNPANHQASTLVPRSSDTSWTDEPVGSTPLEPLVPRKVRADLMLPGHKDSGWSEEEYANLFLREFGGEVGRPVEFTDAVNETLMVSEELFKSNTGQWKLFKNDREKYLHYLADTLINPDEVRIGWTSFGSRNYLRKRFISLYEIPDSEFGTLVIFEFAGGEWRAITSFQSNETYINAQREGFNLIYKKGAP